MVTFNPQNEHFSLFLPYNGISEKRSISPPIFTLFLYPIQNIKRKSVKVLSSKKLVNAWHTFLPNLKSVKALFFEGLINAFPISHCRGEKGKALNLRSKCEKLG